MGLTYNADIVFCIDVSGSMKLFSSLTRELSRFYEAYFHACEKYGKNINELRVRIIKFKDIYYDGKDSIRTTDFFLIPEEKHLLSKELENIVFEGGGEFEENGLEALDLAMNSDWNFSGNRRRHIIVLWTDSGAHTLEKSKKYKPKHYPLNVANSLGELTDRWDEFHDNAKRLILFAPSHSPWEEIGASWENTIFYPSKAGDGLTEVEFDEIISCLINSI